MVVTITIPYKANTLSNGSDGWSDNHIHQGGHRASSLTPEAKGTRDAIIWLLKNAIAKTDWIPVAPLSVDIQGTFRDSKHCIDLQNSITLISNAIQSATRVNDKQFSIHTGLPKFDQNIEPEITITVEQL